MLPPPKTGVPQHAGFFVAVRMAEMREIPRKSVTLGFGLYRIS